ncbi:MAG: hypothetical protein IKQ97_07120 [Eubacterium sp.]|nr:hypothetical protein [Eubacterium sp.]
MFKTLNQFEDSALDTDLFEKVETAKKQKTERTQATENTVLDGFGWGFEKSEERPYKSEQPLVDRSSKAPSYEGKIKRTKNTISDSKSDAKGIFVLVIIVVLLLFGMWFVISWYPSYYASRNAEQEGPITNQTNVLDTPETETVWGDQSSSEKDSQVNPANQENQEAYLVQYQDLNIEKCAFSLPDYWEITFQEENEIQLTAEDEATWATIFVVSGENDIGYDFYESGEFKELYVDDPKGAKEFLAGYGYPTILDYTIDYRETSEIKGYLFNANVVSESGESINLILSWALSKDASEIILIGIKVPKGSGETFIKDFDDMFSTIHLE